MTARARPVVTVYTRRNCELCRRAEETVRRLARGRADVVLVDVDTDAALVDRFGVRVPVVVVGGEEVSHFEVDRKRLRAVLARRGEGRAAAVAGAVGLALHVVLAVFPFAPTGLLAPPWAVAVVYAWWAALLTAGVLLWRRRPALVLGVPIVALAGWLTLLSLGDALFGWTA